MDKNNSMYLNTSLLYRCGQKYYDKNLINYDINAGHLLFLILIYENEGINMQQLAKLGCFDKGTITKSIRRLEELGYVNSMCSPNDKRIRMLYTTDQAKNIIRDLYIIRQQWWEKLTDGIDNDELKQFEKTFQKLTQRAREYEQLEETKTKFYGIQKVSLLDYPQKVAATIFTGGCNFRCPFCHNRDLVFLPENIPELQEDDILAYLNKRKGILDGICISGGEPLLNPDLDIFLQKVKSIGYPIKLDTNGTNPAKLRELIDKKLIDYVAMDIKNTPSKYAETAGILNLDLSQIQESISYLKENHISYEFRTTIVREFHTQQDIKEIAEWLSGAQAWFLQSYTDSENVIQKGLHAHDKQTLLTFLDTARKKIPNTELRGI